jgi:hypothetical protein
MLGRNSYTQDELATCRAAMKGQLDTYRSLTAAVGPGAVDGFEAPFCNNLVSRSTAISSTGSAPSAGRTEIR